MALRPSASLVAAWYARLPEGSNIENARGNLSVAFSRRNKHFSAELIRDSIQRIGGSCPQLGAASWRMPRVAGVLDWRGDGPRARRGQFQRRLTLGRQRRILRMLADGATVREVAAATRANFTVIAALRRAALAWKDPDDEC